MVGYFSAYITFNWDDDNVCYRCVSDGPMGGWAGGQWCSATYSRWCWLSHWISLVCKTTATLNIHIYFNYFSTSYFPPNTLLSNKSSITMLIFTKIEGSKVKVGLAFTIQTENGHTQCCQCWWLECSTSIHKEWSGCQRCEGKLVCGYVELKLWKSVFASCRAIKL